MSIPPGTVIRCLIVFSPFGWVDECPVDAGFDGCWGFGERDGLTLDAQLDRLVRRERRRNIGAQLASSPLDADEIAVLDASVSDVADASR